jgi:hypothetical protein
MAFGLTSAEGDDAPDGIIWRNTDRYAIAGNDFDTKAAHPAAQLREYFVPGITLNAIETSAVHRHHRSLHVN